METVAGNGHMNCFVCFRVININILINISSSLKSNIIIYFSSDPLKLRRSFKKN